MEMVVSVIVLMVVVRLMVLTAKKGLRKNGATRKNMRRSYDAWKRSRRMRYS
jgi:hypothetical protein